MQEEFIDEDLGRVCINRNLRAKNFIARKKAEYIQLTVPMHSSAKQIAEVFSQLKPRLLKLKVKPKLILNPDTDLKTVSFSLKIENLKVRNYHASLKDGLLHIICPDIEDFEDSSVQNILRNTVEQVMRREAKRIFPPKLDYLAKVYGLKYSGITINKSKTRWGSCSSRKSINLSYYCLFLPEYLIDFVILHELCHTVEMNHGEKFWQLLDNVSGGKAKQFTRELKECKFPW